MRVLRVAATGGERSTSAKALRQETALPFQGYLDGDRVEWHSAIIFATVSDGTLPTEVVGIARIATTDQYLRDLMIEQVRSADVLELMNQRISAIATSDRAMEEDWTSSEIVDAFRFEAAAFVSRMVELAASRIKLAGEWISIEIRYLSRDTKTTAAHFLGATPATKH